MKNEYESIEWDSKHGGVVITQQKRIAIQDATGIDEAKKKLRAELEGIVSQIKELKLRGQEVKSLLNKLEGKAGSIDPAL